MHQTAGDSSRRARRRFALKAWTVLALVTVVAGLIAYQIRGETVTCGPPLRPQPGVEMTDFYSDSAASIRAAVSFLPVTDVSNPTQIDHVVRVDDTWEVQPADVAVGQDRTFLGYLMSRTDDCRLSVHRLTGAEMPPGSTETWMVTVMELSSHD